MNEKDDLEESKEKENIEINTNNEATDKQSIYSFKGENNNNISEKISIIKQNDDELLNNVILEGNENNNLKEEEENNINNKISDDEEEENNENKPKEISFVLDYIIFFVLLMSSSFNFSFLYLPFIFETFIYLIWLESISEKGMKLKFILQLFNFGYSIILSLIKLALLSFENGQSTLIVNNIDLFLNLGFCNLRDLKSSYYFIMTFFAEMIILLINLYAIISKEFSNLSKNRQIHYYRKKRNWRLRSLIMIVYLCILGLAMYNTSYLTLFYLFIIQNYIYKLN